MLLPLRALLFGGPGTPPTQTNPIPDILVTDVAPSYSFDLAQYFSGAASYSISPAVEAGWSFNAATAQLVIDTDVLGIYGPFALTVFNGSGSIASNQFSVTVAAFAAAPIFSGFIPNMSYARNVAITPFDVSTYFQGADSYAVLGQLPAGLTFNTLTGVISGIPVAGEAQAIVIAATNTAGTTNSNQFTLTIVAASVACVGTSLLFIIREACKRLGITVPNAAVSSTDLQVQQLVALCNEEGQELSSRYAWQRLTKTATFTTVVSQSQRVRRT
jgi:hypothetical protein